MKQAKDKEHTLMNLIGTHDGMQIIASPEVHVMGGQIVSTVFLHVLGCCGRLGVGGECWGGGSEAARGTSLL